MLRAASGPRGSWALRLSVGECYAGCAAGRSVDGPRGSWVDARGVDRGLPLCPGRVTIWLILAFSAAMCNNNGMPVARARFPRTAYARRAAELAADMSEWVPWLLEFARGPDAWMHSDQEVRRAETRATAIQGIVAELHACAMEISAIR